MVNFESIINSITMATSIKVYYPPVLAFCILIINYTWEISKMASFTSTDSFFLTLELSIRVTSTRESFRAKVYSIRLLQTKAG